MKKILLLLSVVFASIGLFGQQITMSNGTFSACDGIFTDDGVGAAYSATNYTITICPDTPGDVIQLDFSAFALQTSPGNGNSDSFTIFDGDGTNAASLGGYGGSDLQGYQVTGTVNNATGCLTIVFQDNGPDNATSPGWEAAVSCTTPCANPTANSAITNPVPSGAVQTVSVCIGDPVSFSSAGSSAAQGFTIASYNWNFDDGNVQEGNTANATHSFDEAGEYVVTLAVIDNNGCSSLNINPLQVLVSTIPLFPTLADEATCLGEDVTLVGAATSTQWSSLPPQVVAGTTYLADGAGFTYSSSLNFDIFEPDAVLESCNDLLGITVNMEHSYMGDLGISITCPNGTIVNLVEWGVNGGGGTFLGEAIDNDPASDPGIGYTYVWDPDATNGTWGENAGGFGGGSLEAGSYEAQGNLCDLVGCPLNGAWTFSVTDNLAADNGYIFFWGIDLNPALFPGITTFQPTIGLDADSSFWSGPNITYMSQDADTIVFSAPGPGSYDFVYTVENSFGCQFDTTITVTIDQAPFVSAGPDLTYSCDVVQLLGGFQGLPIPTCGADAGNYTYCYNDNESTTWTYCSDSPGDGTAMVITFQQGTTETFWDDLTFYDGPNTSSPIIAAGIEGDLTGLSFQANSGCITMLLNSDGIISCGSGAQTEWIYDVSCTTGGPNFTWEWTPVEPLDNPNAMQPNVVNLSQTTEFTLTGYPVGHPDCFSTDEVTVSLDPLSNPGTDTELDFCVNGAPINMFDEMNGNPVTGGYWTNAAGAVVPEIFTPGVDNAGDYQYNIDNGQCVVFATLTLNESTVQTFEIPNDTTICWAGTLNLDLYDIEDGVQPYQYNWTYNGTTISTQASLSYEPSASGNVCLEVTDQCGVSVTNCFDVTVLPFVDVQFSADTTRACWPQGYEFTIDTDPTTYTNAAWSLGDGTTMVDNPNFDYQYQSPGVYDVSLILTNSLGCSYSLDKDNYIFSYQAPEAQFYGQPQPTDVQNTTIQMFDMTIGEIAIYDWQFNYTDPLGYSNEQNPLFEFPSDQGGEYPVLLTVVDNNGCTDTYIHIITINDIFQYYVPTGFTPNGDGINDVWKLYGADIDDTRFKLQVFNRWGEIVFETTDPNDAWVGGNGLTGEYFIPDGVYLWRARVVSKSTGERKDIEGNLTLMR
jgi:gliding motility-associated-like protein